jgi:DNA ligase-associated metallophosphoesterase
LSRAKRITLGGVELLPDLLGALYIPDFETLLIADLHLEKASSLARRGVHLPPYDTRSTLEALRHSVEWSQPRSIVFLGDSFHDPDGSSRLDRNDREMLATIAGDKDVIWLGGNHDPVPDPCLGGRSGTMLVLGPLVLRHEPSSPLDGQYEIAGHLHPAAALAQRGRLIRCRCHAGDERRLVMSAYGSFTGGLSVGAAPFAQVFESGEFFVWMLGGRAVHRFPASRVS